MSSETTDLRRREASRLTELMLSSDSFSYLRLGDGELNWMLRMQGIETPYRLRYGYSDAASCTKPFSVTGLQPELYRRLRNAVENCSYLDFYDAENADSIQQLELDRSSDRARNPPAA